MNPAYRATVAAIVRRLLAEADGRYAHGRAGLFGLPFASSCAVAAARRVYSEIGRRVESRGARAWDDRTIVPSGRKVALLALGIGDALKLLPRRTANPWRRSPIQQVWTPFAAVARRREVSAAARASR